MIKNILMLPGGGELSSGDSRAAAIQSLTYTQCVNDGDELTVGSACACMIECKVLVPPGGGLHISVGDELVYYQERPELGTRERMGVFIAQKPTQVSANVYGVTAYDRMTLLDVDLSPWLKALSGWPYTLLEFARMVCGECGLTLENASLLNGGHLVKPFYADGVTGRQLIQWVGEAAARFARITPEGKLEFAWYETNDTPITAAAREGPILYLGQDGAVLQTSGAAWFQVGKDRTPAYFQGGLHFEDYAVQPIDKVQIKQGEEDVGVVWPSGAAGTNAYVITGNYLLLTDAEADLGPVAQAIYNALKDVSYTPLRVKLPASGRYRAGEIVEVRDPYGRAARGYIFSRVTAGQATTLESTGGRTRADTGAMNRKTYKNLEGRMLLLRTSVDGLKVEAQDMQGRVAGLELTVGGLSTRVEDTQGKVSRLEQTVDGFRLSVANGRDSSTIKLMSGSAEISSQNIKFSGMVTFEALSGSGKTTINGDNITAGTINGDRIKGGTITGVTIHTVGSDNKGVDLSPAGIDTPSLVVQHQADFHENVIMHATNWQLWLEGVGEKWCRGFANINGYRVPYFND